MLRSRSSWPRTTRTTRTSRVKFFQHFFWIAGGDGPRRRHRDEMWDEEDGFFYDVLRLPDGSGARLKVRSLVGLLPLCAAEPCSKARCSSGSRTSCRRHRSGSSSATATAREHRRSATSPGSSGRRLLVARQRGQAAPHPGAHARRGASSSGRTASARCRRWHQEHPYTFESTGRSPSRGLRAGRVATPGMFGGNSNWRGPVWFPVNLLLMRALLQFHRYYGDDFTVECPTGSGHQMTLYEVARGARPSPDRQRSSAATTGGGRSTAVPRCSRTDPHWRDLSSSTSTSTATTAPGSAPRTRPAGPAWSRASCSCSPRATRRTGRGQPSGS